MINFNRLMPFGEAFELTKDKLDPDNHCLVIGGCKIRRKSWPSGHFVGVQTVEMSPTRFRGYPAQVNEYLCLVKPQRETRETHCGLRVDPWTPTQEDLFANDWKVAP